MPMNIQTTDAIKSLNAISVYRENGMFAYHIYSVISCDT